MQELVEGGYIDKEMVEKITQGESIEQEVIQDIFDKIDEISWVDNISVILPENLRISKKEYLNALEDKDLRVLSILKLEKALLFLSKQINPDAIGAMSLFSSFFTILDKNLILVQENTLDVKNHLTDIDASSNKTLKERIFNYFN